MIANLRHRYMFFAAVSLLFVFSTTYYMRGYPVVATIREHLPSVKEKPKEESKPVHRPKYKPEPNIINFPPIVDNFPLAAAAHSSADLPPIPSWNKPPSPHGDEVTPIFIGFTRNWLLLQQVVVSYITAGWPVEDIYIVENTGVMDSNAKGKLSLQNPFFLNHTRLNMFGVNILRTPTLLTFAQLQNFYLHTAIEKEWPVYFWSHMDVTALSFENRFKQDHPTLVSPTSDHSRYESVYAKAVKELQSIKHLSAPANHWAIRFFAYDYLTLVNTAAFVEVGGWDPMISFYTTDCDMHARLGWAGLKMEIAEAGLIYDVASTLDDLLVLYRKKNTGVKAGFLDPNILMNKIIEEEDKKKEKEKEEEGKREKEKEPEVDEQNKRERSEEETKKADPLSRGEKNRADASTTFSPEKFSVSEWKWEEDDIGSTEFDDLIHTFEAMRESKLASKRGRNTWQISQMGGKGEPFYKDPIGFEKAITMTIDHGRAVFAEKWGHRDCDLNDQGLVTADAWRVEHDW